jgi:hypothetical protein
VSVFSPLSPTWSSRNLQSALGGSRSPRSSVVPLRSQEAWRCQWPLAAQEYMAVSLQPLRSRLVLSYIWVWGIWGAWHLRKGTISSLDRIKKKPRAVLIHVVIACGIDGVVPSGRVSNIELWKSSRTSFMGAVSIRSVRGVPIVFGYAAQRVD